MNNGRDERIVLGCLAKDSITGFIGVVTVMSTWLNGCVRVSIQPQELREGKPIEMQVFDIEQVAYVGPGVNEKPESKRTGGDCPSVKRAAAPKR